MGISGLESAGRFAAENPTYVNWHFKGLALPERRTHQQEEGVMGTENFLFRDLILSPVLSATALGDLPY
jgi:hypothetical protein